VNEGYRYVNDVVNVTVSNSWPKNHAVLRHLIGDDGATMCAIYHLRLYGFVGLLQGLNGKGDRLKIVEFDTELNDGTFVTTANNAEAERSGGYPFQDRLQLPLATAPEIVAHQHRTHLASVLQSKAPGTIPVRILDAEQLQKSQDRLHLKKCEYRKGTGYAIPVSLPAQVSPPLSPLPPPQPANTVMLPSPRRNVRLRPGGSQRVWLPRLFLIPFQVIGLFLIQIVLIGPATRIFGSDLPARIVSDTPDPGDAGRYDVSFVFNGKDGTSRTGHSTIVRHSATRPAIGDRIFVRKLTFLPLSPALTPDDSSSAPGCVELFATVWCGCVGVATLVIWLGPWFDKRMVRDGVATPGIITRMIQTQRGRNLSFELQYVFKAANGAEVVGKQTAYSPAFHSFRENQPVTVLYRVKYPANSQLYEISAYEWAGDRTAK
jgi:hypothetical protein